MLRQERLDSSWVADELGDVSLGDARLDWRLLDSGAKLAARPSASVNEACDEWADTKATYNLFGNQKTTPEQILKPHQQRTRERMAGHARYLVVHDTSFLDYSQHPQTEGLGPIGTSEQPGLGLLMHSSLAVTLDGLPLGVLSQQLWARDEAARQLTPDERRQLPIAEKESNKWLVGLRQSEADKPDGTQLIHVGDSEADVFELFAEAKQLKTDLLVRAGQNRALAEPEVGLLWEVLRNQPAAGELQVQVRARPGRAAREATVAVRFTSLSLKPPKRLRASHKPLALYGLLVEEVDPPADADPLGWLLLTTVPVCDFDQAVERIRWYGLRWRIEILHKILKSGCRIEHAQLTKAQRLQPLIALYTIIAWHLFWLTHLARTDPDAPATACLAEHELQALYHFVHQRPLPPDHCPTVQEAVNWIAQLGGFLARKHDGQPGPTVLWRGWQRLQDIAQAYLAFHPPGTYG